MQSVLTLNEVNLRNQRVLIRCDFNVPLCDGRVVDDTRIIQSLRTIRHALDQGAGVILCSHLGRPVEGEFDAEFSLQSVARALSNELGMTVPLISDWQNADPVQPGQVVLWENVRFNVGEKSNDMALGKAMAVHADVFVMDAFASSHRAHASTVAVAQAASKAVAGLLLEQELYALQKVMSAQKHPVVAVVGGSKVSTKIQLLDSLLDWVDVLIVGGGIANTFIKACGYEVGQSLFEPEYVPLARSLLEKAKQNNVTIPIPSDVVVANEFSQNAQAKTCLVSDVQPDQMILDVGVMAQQHYSELIHTAEMILWNGPVGVFEMNQFAVGTEAVAHAVVDSTAYSLAGGGDTVAALAQFGLKDRVSYVSTGGGAFLECIQGVELPAVKVLMKEYSCVK